jgi:RNA 3'-terminal phosphate cyclase (ATP)
MPFSLCTSTDHSRTNASLIEKFLLVNIDFVEQRPGAWKVDVG